MDQGMPLQNNRIESIDVLRGIAMVIMALDHIRDYFHLAANVDDPLNLATTTPLLFFTRFITHFCAPVFIFLSGTSIYLQSIRKSKKELSRFLFIRGLWLIVVEFALISLAWSFNPHYDFFFFQVIWTIGISMVILSAIIYLPFHLILGLGVLIVFGHNLLDIPESAPNFIHVFWWDLLHSARFSIYPLFANHSAMIVYPFLPWTGLMMVGYCAGAFFSPGFPKAKRIKYLSWTGMALITLFIILRSLNGYGDPMPWTSQKNMLYTLFSFINVNKYPPSLAYLCITIGPALLFLAAIEKVQNRVTSVFRIYGRVALFYYIIHLYIIHILTAIGFFMRGHTLQQAANPGQIFPFYFVVPGEGYGLAVVYLVWAFVVISLYPLCKWYDTYKTTHREKWWLSYL